MVFFNYRVYYILAGFCLLLLSPHFTRGQQTQNANVISFDSSAILLNGKRQLIISGEMHYARSPRELWPQLLDLSKSMGLNCVASYIFWNFHETQKDVYDFSGQRDIGYFLRPCKERNLNVILRSCVSWSAFDGSQPCTWYKTEFSLTPAQLSADADFRIDATGLGKGMLFLNGHALGRYWLIEANGYGADKSWHEERIDGLGLSPAGKPTQQYYHLPRGWLKNENQLIIFEEQERIPYYLNIQIRKF